MAVPGVGWGVSKEKGRRGLPACLLRLKASLGAAVGKEPSVQASTSVLQQEQEVFALLPKGLGGKKKKSGERSSKALPLKKKQKPSRLPLVCEPAIAENRGSMEKEWGTSPPAGFAGSQLLLLSFTRLP